MKRSTNGNLDGRESLERRWWWRSMRSLAFVLALALQGVALAKPGAKQHVEVAIQRGTTGSQAQATPTTARPTARKARRKGLPNNESMNARCAGETGYAQTCYESGPDRSAYGGPGSYSQSHYQLGAGHDD
jgi:hypothetical protein